MSQTHYQNTTQNKPASALGGVESLGAPRESRPPLGMGLWEAPAPGAWAQVPQSLPGLEVLRAL